MRFIYAMLYTYLWAVLACCGLLILLVPSFSRRLFFRIMEKIKVHHVAKYLFFGIIIINFIVWADSISTYYQYQHNLRAQKLEAIVEAKVDYLNLYKQTKYFYMAERNFMLTSSCLFATFVLSRFLAAFGKLYGIEKYIAEFQVAKAKAT